MGDAALADPALIPDYSFLEAAPATGRNTGYLPTAANYQLLSDNIMALSHVDFLHPTTLGGGSLTRAQAEVSELGERVCLRWNVQQDTVPPAFAQHLPNPSAPADQWTAPGLMELSTGIGLPGHPIGSRNLHLMTPETETTTHYFFANTRNFLVDNGDFNRQLDTAITHVFAFEDKPIVEAQQRTMGGTDLMALKPLLLTPDAGAMRVRRKLNALLKRQQAAAS
jgi:vanillate O-demethylase monooxygenase subunit